MSAGAAIPDPSRLFATLSPEQVRALDQVWRTLPEARLVGGVVRDLLARRNSADIDLATPEPPEQVMHRLGEAHIRAIPTGLSHGTVTALLQGHPIEITTLRRDEATDGRHAVVAWTADWREDAARRDFTFNAMSLSRDPVRQDYALHDYFGGAADLAAGRVRFVGAAARRIEEDALRTLRFFRFQARYGTGAPDPEAVAAIAAAAPTLGGLSAERVWSELRRILLAPTSNTTDPAASLLLMQSLGILDRLLPGGADAEQLVRRLARTTLPDESRDDAVLRLAALLCGPAGPVAAALKLSGAEGVRLGDLLADRPAPRPGLDDAALRRMLADEPAAILLGRSWLIEDAGDPLAWQQVREQLRRIEPPVFPLAGRDLLASGVPAGPSVGRLLAATRDWWQAGGCVADHAACLAHCRAAALAAGVLQRQ
ncbi:CCA tRNA nucleotidyltransferase [Lichenicoccus sp.]|uniref:CCA tRNA nucleotidyltransferase n=1 Tax=Lichenicoccus sp. TaxID=2781899 RepID=UPI003D0BF1B2